TLYNGIDIAQRMGCGTMSSPTCGSTLTTAAMVGASQSTYNGVPSITSVNEGGVNSQMTTYATALETYVRANYPDAPIEKIIGGKLPDLTYAPTIGSSLPYTSSAQYTWTGDIPDQFRTTFALHADPDGTWTSTAMNVSFFADELGGRIVSAHT